MMIQQQGTKSPTTICLRRVLVAAVILLLTTTVFAGAEAAAGTEVGTLFYFEKATNPAMDGTWNYGTYSFTIDTTDPNGNFVGDTKLIAGKYKQGDSYLSLKRPTANVILIATLNGEDYVVDNGGILFNNSLFNTFSAKAPGIAQPSSYLVIGPDYVTKKVDTLAAGDYSKIGKYQIKALFDENDFVLGAPANALESNVIFSFNVVDSTAELSVATTDIFVGDLIKLSITGKPGSTYYITGWEEIFHVIDSIYGSQIVANDNISIKLPNDGKAYIFFNAHKEGIATVKITECGKDIYDSKVEAIVSSAVPTDVPPYGDRGKIIIKSNAEGATVSLYSINNDLAYTGKIANGQAEIYVYSTGTSLKSAVVFRDGYEPTVIPINGNPAAGEIATYTANLEPIQTGTIEIDLKPISIKAGNSFALDINITDIQASEPVRFNVDVRDKRGKTIDTSLSSLLVSIKGENFDEAKSMIIVGNYPVCNGFSFSSDGWPTFITISGEIKAIDPSKPVSLVIGLNGVLATPVEIEGAKAIICVDNIEKIADGAKISVVESVFGKQETIVIKDGSIVIIDEMQELLPLHSGWNFISIPKTLNASCDTAGELLANVETGGTSILGYDAKTGWYTLSRDSPIKPLDGYWIYSASEAKVPLEYKESQTSLPATKQLYQGWNAVGISSNYEITARTAFAQLDWVRYIPWNVEAQNWGRTFVMGGSIQDSEENYVSLRNGGWLYMKADGIYTGNAA